MPTPLGDGESVELHRDFHVEVLRGGMNRLLLRSMRSADEPTRVEVHFQYVQHVDAPMAMADVSIEDVTASRPERFVAVLQRFPECRVFRLTSDARVVAWVVAAACVVGEDHAGPGEPSMFPMMG